MRGFGGVALTWLRSRPGARRVQFPPWAVRGGNLLYYWQWAYGQRVAGNGASVLRTPAMQDWVTEFPALQDITVDKDQVGLLDGRVFATRHHYGTSFSREENRAFCAWILARSPSFQRRLRMSRDVVAPETCVVNVRRGDYYSNPRFEVEFGIDIASHVREALALMSSAGRPTSDILVVSDDNDWCAAHLAPGVRGKVRYLDHRVSMFDDLAALAVSRNMILANSTFSYWGSFIAQTLDDDHLAIAPPYHQRVKGGVVVDDLFDPRWRRTSGFVITQEAES